MSECVVAQFLLRHGVDIKIFLVIVIVLVIVTKISQI